MYYAFAVLICLLSCLYTITHTVDTLLDTNYTSNHHVLASQDTATIPWYSMRINFPATFKKMPVLCGYYKGYKLEFDENLCIIPENKPTCSYFTIIITEHVKYTNQDTLEHLERLANKPCRLFHVSRKNAQWHIQEEHADNIPLRLPAEALVLLINPALVDGFNTYTSFQSQMPIITLPTLYIKSTITQQKFDLHAIRSLSASLDVNPMHSRVQKAIKKERSFVLSLRKPA